MWGQVPLLQLLSAFPGIIPTRVGTSDFRYTLDYAVEDHPHACGDKVVFVVCSSDWGGSSPRVWGQAYQGFAKQNYTRIIPTRVGTRQNAYQGFAKQKDHPHACGDKVQDIVHL